MQLRAAAAGLFLAFVAGQAVAASFDCSKASSFSEKEICRDSYLSGLDDWLAKSYKAALELNPDQDGAVRQSQREWLTTRNSCGDQKCLDNTIGARIQVLDQYVRAEKGKAASALAQTQLIKRQEAEAIRQRQTAEHLAAEDAARQGQIEGQQQQAIIGLQQRNQQSPSQIPQYQQPRQVTQASSSISASPSYHAQEKSLWQQFKSGPAWKYMLLVAALLTGCAMWRHYRGQTTIYNDYTDATITNLLPAAGVVLALLMTWLELPRQLAMGAGLTGASLALMFALYASVRTNQGWLSITVSLIAKITLMSLFFVVIGALVASLFASTRYKGESQARANARNRREKKETMAMIAALTTAYTFLSAWMCRRQEFIPVSECLAFESTASVA